jgi:hypothetical protein
MLTLADISQFRDLLKTADYSGPRASACGKPRAEAALVKAIRPHLAEMLSAAEALVKIKDIAGVDNPTREEDMHRDFARRVCAVLDEHGHA